MYATSQEQPPGAAPASTLPGATVPSSGWMQAVLDLAHGVQADVHRLTVTEALSTPFTIDILARTPDATLDLGTLVGGAASLRVTLTHRSGRVQTRRWTGLCQRARLLRGVELAEGETAISTYALTLVPALTRLAQRTDYRAYQHQRLPDIVRDLLARWGIDTRWHIDPPAHPSVPTKVQYEETDLAFITRLLEEAGIATCFLDDDAEGSTLLLSDALHVAGPRRDEPLLYLPGANDLADGDVVTDLTLDETQPLPRLVIRDHDFSRPTWPLTASAACAPPSAPDALEEHFTYRPGAFLVDTQDEVSAADGVDARLCGSPAPSSNPASPASRPERHDERYGALLAERVLHAARIGHRTLGFSTNSLDLAPGTTLTITGHPRADITRAAGWLVTTRTLEIHPDGGWLVSGTAVPADQPYRPPQRTPKPRSHGVQSALVVGPKGQEIHTDAHGRVQVVFPWQRELPCNDDTGASRSGTSSFAASPFPIDSSPSPAQPPSCWLRVSQGWAGAAHGLVALPRVGQEVLVAFLDGDPDQPIVVGRVANALNPLPAHLPEQKTHTVWRSASSPGGATFNEIRFDDTARNETLSLHAGRDLRAQITLDETHRIGRHRVTLIGGGDSARIEGRAVRYLGDDAHVTVAGEARLRVGGALSLTVEGDQFARIDGRAAFEADVIHLRADGALVLEGADITLRGPGGFVRIDGGGVTIDGGAVRIQQGGAPGRGEGAEPALPVIPLRGDAERPPPRRLPLFFEFPAVPKGQWPGRGESLTPDDHFLCSIICWCSDTPLPQSCVTRKLRELDRASGGTSRYKAEVRYDMTQTPPVPIMSKREPWRPTTGNPKGCRSPDVVIVKDPSKPPTQDNLEEVVEIKFGKDALGDEQRKEYRRIAGSDVLFRVLSPDDCGCPQPRKEEPRPVEEENPHGEARMVLLMLLAAIALVLDDALPGGQADDVLLPPVLARLAAGLAKLRPVIQAWLTPPAPPLPLPTLNE
ncbi:type VI secretion system tip protein VgrG [Chondromyces crocatus]|uniref:VRR-NUC domain-containing protein n=1 Tax=Chondromyces crocatus TaxID=52 RepID=A0A0K1EBD0_CHOCO|nr:type VI secretion system tip protein VgrG [Chondromyces crocatus]AKT37888.1 uncharacterized protein CMC5_020310 [Chondromyces crocatus]